MKVISGRQTQACHEFKATWATKEDPISKREKKKKKAVIRLTVQGV